MSARLKERFSLKSIYKQEEDRRMARILLTMIIVYLVASLTILFTDLAWGDGSLSTFITIGNILQILPLVALFKGKLSASSYMATGIYIGFTTLFATTGHGIHDYVIITYPAIIMFAGLTNQRRGLIVSTLLTLAALIWLTLGEMNGRFVVYKTYAPDLVDMIAICLLIVIAAIAVHLLVSNMEYGLAQTWRELAQRQRAEEELRKSHEEFRRYFNMGTVGMAVTSADKGWIEVNDRLCEIFGYSKDELSKLTWADITHPDDLNANLELFNRMAAKEIDSFQMDKRYVRKDGSVVYTTIFASCHRNPDGTVNHLLTSIIDITEHKQAEEALNKSEMMYRLLAENVSDVIWIIDLNERRFRYVSPSVERLRGYTPQEVMAQDIDAALTPSSLQFIPGEMSLRSQAHQEGYQGYYVDEVEQPCKDGSTVWMEATINFHTNEANGHIEIYGVSRDITERKRNEAISQIRLKLTELAGNNTLDEIMQKALDEIVRFANSEFGVYLFVEPDQQSLSLQAGSARKAGEYYKIDEKNTRYDINKAGTWGECVRQYKPIVRNDYTSLPYRGMLPDTHIEAARELAVPVFRDGKVVSVLGIGNKSSNYTEKDVESVSFLADVVWEIVKRKQTERSLEEVNDLLRAHLLEIEQLHEELREQAIRDPLTGLYNRRYMHDIFGQEFFRARRENYPVSVIMMDMDELKILNDTYGHHIGDQALQAFAFHLQAMTRKEDIICRYGGDEFTVILSKAFPKDAVKRVEEWRKVMGNHPLEIEGKNEVTIKFTAGIASFPAHGTALEEIVNYADVALYRAKARGRNCTVVFEGPS